VEERWRSGRGSWLSRMRSIYQSAAASAPIGSSRRLNPGIYLIYDDTKAIKATNCLVCDVPLGIYETRSIYESECRCLGSMECT